MSDKKMFKRKLTDDELAGLEWNIEGICKSPDLHAQLMQMVDEVDPLPFHVPLDYPKQIFLSTPRRTSWMRFWARRNRKGNAHE